MDLLLKNIDPIAVKKIDKIKKEKKISRQDFFKNRFRKEGGTERERIMTKGEKRNRKMDLRSFLHGIMEHILHKKKCSIRNGTLKKAKVWRRSEG